MRFTHDAVLHAEGDVAHTVEAGEAGEPGVGRGDGEHAHALAVVLDLEGIVAHVRDLTADLRYQHVEGRDRVGKVVRQLSYLLVYLAAAEKGLVSECSVGEAVYCC